MVVKKDFNAAIVHESELITSFLYAVQNQGMHYKCLWEFTRQVVNSLRREEFPYAIRAVQGKIGQVVRDVITTDRNAQSISTQQVTATGDIEPRR